jgi:hypothetical protein
VQTAQAKAIELVFDAVNESNPSKEALAYQYLQMLPKLAENPANKVLVVPTDYAGLAGLAATLGNVGLDGASSAGSANGTGNGNGARPRMTGDGTGAPRFPTPAQPQALLQGLPQGQDNS